ncbi:hypothetical protein SAE01_01030 [Segetibacter aerophilus]|uniref:Galactosyltransferase C-terminal domain-containing protein n=1 Tax=Segetibacter aerophilus TaxID=670293 RepID=A0A512B737_9BACT|nr:hypothetical protein SAE01_01030 [Segetibacter aerophilus]
MIFIDYGSDKELAAGVKKVVEDYEFARYYYSCSEGLFWSRAHALNTGIKKASGDTLLMYDIDLIVEADFLKKISGLNYDRQFYTFSCFYLPAHFNLENKDLTKDGVHYEQNYVGLCAVKKEFVFDLGGFDEYFAVWGGEDDDLYERLKWVGVEREQMTASDFKVFHQWHPSQAPTTPSTWYLTMVDYLYSKKRNGSRLNEWGKLYKAEGRVCLTLFNNRQYYSKHRLQLLEKERFLFFNLLIKDVHELEAGETAYLEHEFRAISKKSKFRFISNSKNSATALNLISIEKIKDFFENFIGVNRKLFNDYFFCISDTKLLFICQKK